MDASKCEKSELMEVMDSEDPNANCETESPSVSEDSESCYEHLKPTGVQIGTDDFSGEFNFDFFLDPTEVTKRHWMYSEKLNKIFLDMNRVVPIQFHWNFYETELLGMKNLQIRALLIFATPEFEQLSIKRCPIHIIQDKFCDKKKIEHILWCEQYDSIYEEDPKSQRYSVVVQMHDCFPYSEYKTYNIMYKFMCKSSCSMSLNRRPINVIFTLETSQGQVLGRKKIGVKICSCPKRDSMKEEALEKKKTINSIKMFKKRTSQISNNDTPKKMPKTNNDNEENKSYELPLLAIPTKKLYISTLELLHGHFLGNAVRENMLIDSHPLISMLADLISQVKSENLVV
ncbi:cellular tumor antigen p53-like isoform X2 [Sipha flava]|uniref:Cellular tumor antigen p53-like isoform X2 n=1 Tax=Sipha flava TaxID=143950 RepID=A0A8B8G9Z6_9HEMI|nr:cellular tumor antigen p53-like isoform X2 [Sipha flava]